MKYSDDQINIIINDILEVWAMQELRYYRERAAKVPAASGAGRRDIHVGFRRASAASLAEVSISFHEYMRYRDMKYLNTKYFPIEAAIKWIEDKGVNKFKNKYQRVTGRKLPTDQRKMLMQIAWGIVKGQRKHRPRNWYAKYKWRGINVLFARVADRMGNTLLGAMKHEMTNK